MSYIHHGHVITRSPAPRLLLLLNLDYVFTDKLAQERSFILFLHYDTEKLNN